MTGLGQGGEQMTDDIIFGSGVPGWSSEQVQIELAERSILRFDNKTNLFGKDLSKLLRDQDKHGWPVRHQHARGTCNAFSVVAMEELQRFFGSGTYEPLSEEHLYAKARKKPPTRLPEPLTEQAQKILDEKGGTYLSQMMDALIQDGLADAADAKYEPTAVLGSEKEIKFSTEIEGKAQDRRVEADLLFHDITTESVGTCRQWKSNTARGNLAEFFARQLENNKPIAAAFAILNDAEYVWTGNYARTSGHVRYPTDKIVEGKRPVAGHSVCLVGYGRNPDDDGTNPWMFLFRNSYGTRIFAKNADQFPDGLNKDLPGYGIISGNDVIRYCWEFLTRASPDDIAVLTGVGLSPFEEI
jgi:hypothetical protein